jgi:hypothetical protein
MLNSALAFLDQQPWWVIAAGTLAVVTLLRCAPVSSAVGRRRATVKRPGPGFDSPDRLSLPTIQVSEIVFGEREARELQALLRSGDKLAAIRLVRSKKGIDLRGAKELIESLAESPTTFRS